jgi:hypothetical protein
MSSPSPVELRFFFSELYQLVLCMAVRDGSNDHPAVEQALDNLTAGMLGKPFPHRRLPPLDGLNLE